MAAHIVNKSALVMFQLGYFSVEARVKANALGAIIDTPSVFYAINGEVDERRAADQHESSISFGQLRFVIH